MEENKKLTGSQYWEWRTTIEEMNHSETKYNLIHTKACLMEKEIEIQKLKLMLFKQSIKNASEAYQNSKKEYDRFKSSLEKELGISLNDKLIDEVTFEVKELPT